MHPVICKIGPFTVYAYGFMLALAFTSSSFLLILQAKKQKFNPDTIFNFAFIVFISGIVGARIFYILEQIGYYRENLLEIIMLQRGGLSWFGGLILGIFSGAVYLKNKKLAVYKVLDLVVPFVALGQAIGRVGCLLNGCCYGKISGSGIYFEIHKSTLIPTQLYSALALLVIYVVLRFLQDRPHRDGQIFFSYLLLYSMKRFFMEFWRAEHEIFFFSLTLFQVISIVIFCLSSLKLLSMRKLQ